MSSDSKKQKRISVSKKTKMEETERIIIQQLVAFIHLLLTANLNCLKAVKCMMFVMTTAIIFTICHATESLQAPLFTTQPSASSNIISEGRTKILQCQALGYPQPRYRWLRDGESLGDFSSEPFYKILSTRREDAGSYQCVAHNDVGSILSQRIDFMVAYMGVFENQSEKLVHVESGRAAILDLPPIESFPTPSVTWQSDLGPLPYDHKYAVTSKHQLVILSASEADQKAYRARAINTQSGKEENSAYILVNVTGDYSFEVAPEIIIEPMDMKIVKGQHLSELQCIANARPLHELETLWLKDGILIENSGLSYNFNDPWNRTLGLLSANLTYNGQYTCQVRLRSGGFPTVTSTAKVTVHEKPKFINNFRTETLGDYGSQITLPCDVMGEPAPLIKWYKNVREVNGDEYQIEEDGSLVIKHLVASDSAMFQCVATNEAGEETAYTWVKIKTSLPIMELGPENVTVLDGKDATISCRAVGAPTPNISWFYNDMELLELSGHIQVLESGDLLISDVAEADAGLYKCIRANEAGFVSGKALLSVIVRTQIIQPPVDTSVLLGLTATLQCKVSSDPSVPYQIDWSQNHQLISIGNNQRITILPDGTLEIQAVRATDVGQYSCFVTSPGGNETRTAYLSVIELPFAPINIKAEKLETSTQRAVNVSWVPGFDGNSPTTKFIVEKREVPELGPLPDPLMNWVTELSNVSAEQRWVLLTNLKAAACYQFRVSTVNSVGEGSPSEPSNMIMLPQEAPSGPPLGFVGSARSSSQIITQWQPPLEEHRNGQILGYIIRYRLFGYNNSPWTSNNITNEAQRNFLIKELITWKDYAVQIAAYNDKGIGVFTSSAKIKTKEGVPDAPPENVKAKAVNSTAVRIWWKPPDPQKINGINQGYKIQAWINEVDQHMSRIQVEAKMITVPPSLFDSLAEQSAVMGGLEKYSEYNITVLCFTDPGDGKRSKSVPVRTNEDVPGEVSVLQFSDISDRAVNVIWGPPKQINGILTGYQIRYQIKDNPDTLKILNFTSDITSLMVTQLQATTHYWFEITARTIKGAGLPRIATIQSGVEPVLPEAPYQLALSNIEAFSVVLQFTPGFDGNSSITLWKVEAQTARNSTWFTVIEISDPEATTLTVTGLVPFTVYKLRLLASNVMGSSAPSEPSKEFQTIQAPPSHPPRNVTVRAMSATELRVRWIPLQQIEWFGNPRGYNISYHPIGPHLKNEVRSVLIEDHTANSHVLDGLEEWTLYSVSMHACNDVGRSTSSPVALERTREAVPSFGPLNIEANATSSTTIVVKWNEVPPEHQNGQIEGYKVYYGAGMRDPVQFKQILDNSTFITTLTELKKYVQYHIQILAFTRLGDGVLSSSSIRVQTFEDAPGAPSNVSFPDVSYTTARVIWDVPEDPNGEILAYRVTYHMNTNAEFNHSRDFSPSDRTFRATELIAEQYYMFSVTAQTKLGWGKTALALVYTTNNREIPQPPSIPQISRSQIQSQQITFSWTPGRDGFAPLRYYTVQLREDDGPWHSLSERVNPSVTSFTALSLKPYTTYQFRIRATNDIGPSRYSIESILARTLPAAPSKEISNLVAVPITPTSVRVQWDILPSQYWSGDNETGGYRVLFQPVTDFPTALQTTPKEDIRDVNLGTLILSDLIQDRNYEIIVVAFNSQGLGPPCPPITVYVGEAVPTGEPRNIVAKAVSSTEVRVEWKPPKQNMQNGELLGYKIFYLATDSPQDSEPDKPTEEEIEVIPATYNTHSLVFLDKYTEYRIQLLAFNPAGDGPRSPPITVRTLQGLPGSPMNLMFSDITMNSLHMIWKPPKRRNGEILGYVVTYETTEQNEQFSKQVKQKVTDTSLLVHGLEEEVSYTFTVRAQTKIDFGPAIIGNVTTGPQEGSPMSPRELTITKTISSIEMHWNNGASGRGPILGYYIETRKKNEGRWETVAHTNNGPLQDFIVSYQSLLPSTSYKFRVITYNQFGISYPLYAEDSVLTPSKLYLEYGYLQHKPFYRQTWFMITLAATSIVIIIMVISILCIKSKSYKYKQEAQKTLEESMSMDTSDNQELALELYKSRHIPTSTSGTLGNHGTLGRRNGTLSRKTNHGPHHAALAVLGKSPPRPSPASVAYHSDEESLKGYDGNPDDSSVTEKPSEISSSESQESESENESVRSDPHSFVNHYANVNDSLRQSWKRQKPVRNYSSYTDSEPEGSAVVSLNGGQIIMNNMARSRAPLPGFSSFV